MKNKIKISLLLLIVFYSFNSVENTYSQSGWYQINSPSPSTALKGIYFKNSNTGIISGFKTTNGGQAWVDNRPGVISGISFPDTAIGYCCTGTSIYKTVNLGDNWLQQQNPVSGLNSIYFINVYTGYACGPANSIIKTTNGGINWLIVNNNLPYYYYYTNLFFINAASGYIIGFGDTSYILKTTDGGQNWNIKYFNGQQFYSIFFINSNTGFVGGTNIFRTTDSGVSWNQYSYNSQPLFSLYFPSFNIGYGCYANGDIIKTTNGGNSWFREYPVTGNELFSIFFINDSTGYACGSNGTVLKTTNGGGPPIGIKPIGTETPKTFSLSQNYPNPFNPTTKIKFCIPNYSDERTEVVKLIVFDILGREIATLVNEKLSPGIYEVDWNGSNFNSGVYFYRIEAGSFIETKKMIILT
jgi:photosystem II stability/assembly factor-like uncharacterized protein